MKKSNYILIILMTVSLTVVSCKKFLEKEPFNTTGKNTLFETVDGAKAAMNGVYNRTLEYYKEDFAMYGDVASDNLIRTASGTTMVDQFNFESATVDDALAVGDIWLNIYSALNNANNILAAVPELKTRFPDQTSTLESITGQALAMRALFHFDLCRVYAQPYNSTNDASHMGIPIVLKTPSPGQQLARNTVKEVYDQIIADLTTSLPLLEQHANATAQTRMSYQAALALLSRVYLYKGDWTQCLNYANMVIQDNRYQLVSAADYSGIFLATNPQDNSGKKIEMIFQLTNAGLANSPSNIANIFSDAAAAEYGASGKLRNLYDADDIRFTRMFTIPATGKNTQRYLTKKYADGVVSAVRPPAIQIIRLSEVYLNRAEALWNLQRYAEAADDLEFISQRAHPSRQITVNTTGVDLGRQIMEERNRELCMENHRLFDLIRRKEALTRGVDCNANTCVLSYPNDKFVLPIPSRETQANTALIQNPGFN